MFLLSLPFIIAMTLPMAVLLAVLYAFSTLAAGNEITAMRASGISIGQLLRPVFAAALLLTAADFVFVDQGLPAANLRLKALIFDIGRKRPTLELREQALNEVPPSQLYLRAGRIDPATGRLRDVTIYDMSGQQGRQVIYADSGQMGFEANQVDLYLTLHAGSILQFKGADPGLLQLTYFTDEHHPGPERGQRAPAHRRRRAQERPGNDDLRDARGGGRHRRGDPHLRKATRGAARGRPAGPPRPAARPADPPGIPPRTAARPGAAGSRRPGTRLLPETADAQTPAQRPAQEPAQIPGFKRELLKQRVKSFDTTSAAAPPATPADSRAPPRPTASSGRQVALTSWVDAANTAEGIRTATRTADGYLVEVHKKYAITVACMVFVLVGIPLALRFPRGGMGLVLGGGLGIFALYYVSLTAGEPLADAGIIPPAVVMWAPNVVFTLLGLFGLLRVNRELGSTRGGDAAELVDLVRRQVTRWRRRP